MTKGQTGEKRGYLAYTSISQLLKKVRTGAQTRLEPGCRNWRRSHGGEPFTWLTQSDLFQNPGPPGQGCPYPQKAGPSSIDHSFRKCPLSLSDFSPTLRRHFPSWGSLLSGDYSLCQGDIRVARPRSLLVLYLSSAVQFLQSIPHNRDLFDLLFTI